MSPYFLFNIFLVRIMTDALEDHEGTVSIGGRTITNLHLADDIGGLAGEEEELANLVERLDKSSTAYGMEISAEKTKLMTNNTSGINTEIKLNGQKLETVTSFKYLGSVITDEGSKPEILSKIAQTTAALTRLKPVWIDKSISLSSKIRLMCSLFTSSSCMLVNHAPPQQSSKEEFKPWKRGATTRYYTSHTKTMLPTRKSMPRSSRQLDHTKT